MAIGVRQALILRALKDRPEIAYAGGVHEVIYAKTAGRVIITSDAVCQVFKTLQVRGLIVQVAMPLDAQLARRGRRGGPRKFYGLTEAGEAELKTVDKIISIFRDRDWRPV